MKTIFDADFQYTPSHSTDIRRTFARVRAEQARAKQAESPFDHPAVVNLWNEAILAEYKRGRQ
jgi:hypothetical protein